MSYCGDAATIGTLALILVYMSVAGTQALNTFRSRQPLLCVAGLLGVVLLIWPLWNSLYPVPPWPEAVLPYIVVAWLALGILLAVPRPYSPVPAPEAAP